MPVGEVFAFGPFHLDLKTRLLTRNGDVVFLTARQFELLQLLVSRAGQVSVVAEVVEVLGR